LHRSLLFYDSNVKLTWEIGPKLGKGRLYRVNHADASLCNHHIIHWEVL
jgi:hypothetical protein